jgi:hypothetical protein
MTQTTPDFFPLAKDSVRQYAVVKAQGKGLLSIEVSAVTTAGGETVAQCSRTTLWNEELPKVEEYEVVKNSVEVLCDGVTELKFPLQKGTEWIISPRRYTIEALDAEVATVAGVFKNCLRVAYLIAEGDGGSGERWYAPGVGLVKIVENDEGDPFTHELISYLD